MSVKSVALVLTSVLVALGLQTGVAHAGSPFTYAAPSSIQLTTEAETSIQIPISPSTSQDYFVAFQQSPAEEAGPGGEAYFQADASLSNPTFDAEGNQVFSAIALKITPLHNGDAVLRIYPEYYSEDYTDIAVHIAVPSLNAYTPEVETSCPTVANIGRRFDCTFSYTASGPGAALATPAVATVWAHGTGRPWSKPVRFTVKPDEDSGFSYPMGKSPVYAKVQWNVGDKKARFFVIAPLANATISAPGAAIVGDSFTVRVSVNPGYSGFCVLNGQHLIKISFGRGSVSVYGTAPGQLRLPLVCNNKTWYASSSFTMWIRG